MTRLLSLVLALGALAILADTASACDRGRTVSSGYYYAPSYYPGRVYYAPAMTRVDSQTESFYLDPNVSESRYVSQDGTTTYIIPRPVFLVPRMNYPLFPDDQPNDNWN